MKFIAILGAGVALSLGGCDSSDSGSRTLYANAAAPANDEASSADESDADSGSGASDEAPQEQDEGAPVDGTPVEPTVNPSDGSQAPAADSDTSSNDQPADQASDQPDEQASDPADGQ